ncbi:hypothetical protein [Mycolicibacterium iranicum]|uniref:hypothetical protein n=1 Tax=Mycolicibacterium iranicum TaxID=912594 RepID=UPI0010426A1D|nr:hypothetical protein [Mycolicibacterium iranicum]
MTAEMHGATSYPDRWALTSAPISAVPDDVINDLVAATTTLRRCAQTRRALRGASSTFPASLLRIEPVAEWMRKRGIGIDVRTPDDFIDFARSGVAAKYATVHCHSDDTTVTRAGRSGIRRLVVSAPRDVDALTRHDSMPWQVIVDATDIDRLATVAQYLAEPGHEMIGVRCNLAGHDDREIARHLRDVVGTLAAMRRRSGTIVCRILLDHYGPLSHHRPPAEVRWHAHLLEDLVEQACARHRYPRPALVVPLSRSVFD